MLMAKHHVTRAGLLAMIAVVSLAAPVAARDSDGDGLRDSFELAYGLTDQLQPDSDHDGLIDSAEDSDGDGLSDRGEQRVGTDPSLVDTDGDGVTDADEDHDGDGRPNRLEQDQRPLPRDLRPPLPTARSDSQPWRQRCQTWHGQSRLTACSFGPADAETHIVLAGDSHATMYLTPMRRLAVHNGWRLTTLTKNACPALPGLFGNNQWRVDRGRTCRRWQERVETHLVEHPVDLVVYAHTPGYRLRRPDGSSVPSGQRADEWRQALEHALARLPAPTTVLALGGIPRNFGGNPLACLRANRRDMSACTSRHQPLQRRAMDSGLVQAAGAGGGRFDSLYDQICSYDPCPLVQGDVLMWRDRGHLSETFVRQLEPPLERILLAALAPGSDATAGLASEER